MMINKASQNNQNKVKMMKKKV